MNSITVSILFATYKRGEILRSTLESLAALEHCSFQYEIIVVDNACESCTENLVNSYSDRLPLRYLQEPTPGKNSALLTGLAQAAGEILIFTDDDIIAEADWLREFVAGIHRRPDYDLFGGRILPSLPHGASDELGLLQRTGSFIKSAYVIADWDLPEGPIKVGHIWGPNMAVRRRVFDSGITFDPNIGPNGNNYIMGSESDFLNRAANQGFKGAYIPSAVVKHQIRPEQLNLSWLAGRAYRWGRGSVRRTPPKSKFQFLNAPLYLYRKCINEYLKYVWANLLNQTDRIEKMIAFNITKGALVQMVHDRNKKS
jgi:glycosyltransferase involved in cell wall biosynthesis